MQRADREARDPEPQETREWLESLEWVLREKGSARARYLIQQLDQRARREGVTIPYSANTPYINTIPVQDQPPYPGDLDRACTPYWESQGFDVLARTGPALEEARFHPIYAMPGAGVLAAYRRLSASGADAVLMLGTGMATLRPLLAGRDEGLSPASSCNLALAWAATQGRNRDALSEADLPAWLSGAHWRARLDALFTEAPEKA